MKLMNFHVGVIIDKVYSKYNELSSYFCRFLLLLSPPTTSFNLEFEILA